MRLIHYSSSMGNKTHHTERRFLLTKEGFYSNHEGREQNKQATYVTQILFFYSLFIQIVFFSNQENLIFDQ